jgi:hypothetical protein
MKIENAIKKLEKEKERAQLKDEYLKCLRLGDKLENLRRQLKNKGRKLKIKKGKNYDKKENYQAR